MRTPGLRRVVAILLLIVIVLGATWLRVRLWSAEPVYVSDAAFRVRLARMYARGDEPPTVDESVLPPAGTRLREELFLTQDALAGWTYRLLHDEYDEAAFDRHLAVFCSLTASLVAVGAYLLARLLGRKRWAALLAGLIAAAAPALLARGGDVYLREHLALPAILLGWAGMLAVLRELEGESSSSPRALIGWSILAAAGWAAALVTWHLSGFVLTVTALLLAVYLIWRLPRWSTGEYEERVRGLGLLFAALAGATLLCSLFAGALRAKGFYMAPGVSLLIGGALLLNLPVLRRSLGRRWWATAGALAGWTIAVVLLGRLLGAGHGGQFSHIYSLLVAKLVNLGVKPPDPVALDWTTSALWSGPFASPSAYDFLHAHWLLWPLGLGGAALLIVRLRRGEQSPAALFVLILLAGFLMGGLLFSRLAVFFAPLAAVTAASLADWRPGKLRPGPWLLGLLTLSALFQALFLDRHNLVKDVLDDIAPPEPAWPHDLGGELDAVADWLSANTPPDAVIAARYNLAPMLLLKTERPIALHSIWESPRVRLRSELFSKAMFADTALFENLLRSWGVDYLIVSAADHLDAGPESARYNADALASDPGEALSVLCLEPEIPAGFRLAHQTTSFRIFTVGEPAAVDYFYGDEQSRRLTGAAASLPAVGPYSPFFDAESPFVALSDDRLGRVVDAVENYNLAAELYNHGVYGSAGRLFEDILTEIGDLRRSAWWLAQCRYRENDPRARAALELHLRHCPGDLEALILGIKLRAQGWDIDGALFETRRLQALLPEEPRLYRLEADLQRGLGRRAEARRLEELAAVLEVTP